MRRDLVKKLGQAYENVISDPICRSEKVKKTLQDEIAEAYFREGYREILSGQMEEEYEA